MAKWNREAILALGVQTDLATAARVLGVSRGLAYSLARRGELPFPILRLGRKIVVPMAGLVRALGLDDEGPT